MVHVTFLSGFLASGVYVCDPYCFRAFARLIDGWELVWSVGDMIICCIGGGDEATATSAVVWDGKQQNGAETNRSFKGGEVKI